MAIIFVSSHVDIEPDLLLGCRVHPPVRGPPEDEFSIHEFVYSTGILELRRRGRGRHRLLRYAVCRMAVRAVAEPTIGLHVAIATEGLLGLYFAVNMGLKPRVAPDLDGCVD
jgi:hypothetical protein